MELARFLQLHAVAYMQGQRWIGEGFWAFPLDDAEQDFVQLAVAEAFGQSLKRLAGLSELRVTVELSTFTVTKAAGEKLRSTVDGLREASPDRITWVLNKESKYERKLYRG